MKPKHSDASRGHYQGPDRFQISHWLSCDSSVKEACAIGVKCAACWPAVLGRSASVAAKTRCLNTCWLPSRQTIQLKICAGCISARLASKDSQTAHYLVRVYCRTQQIILLPLFSLALLATVSIP